MDVAEWRRKEEEEEEEQEKDKGNGEEGKRRWLGQVGKRGRETW